MSWKKAFEREDQIICLSIFNRQASILVAEAPAEDFLRPENREIKKCIEHLLNENQVVSTTAIHNMLSDESKEHFGVNIATSQTYGDPYTIMAQFKSFSRMCNMSHEIGALYDVSLSGQNLFFEESLESFIDKWSGSKEVKDAVEISGTMEEEESDEIDTSKYFKVPIKSLSEMVKYMRSGQYVCISGSPGTGKSTLAGILFELIPNTLLQSYEMKVKEIKNVILSRNTGINSEKIENRELNFEEKQKIAVQKRRLAVDLTGRISDFPHKSNDLFALIRRMKAKHDINAVIIDYAQLIPLPATKGNKTEQYEDLSRKFKLLATELDILVIALSSVNGAILKEQRMPLLSDLRGSVSFGADADTVIFTYSETIDGREEMCLSVAKQRKGRTGKVDGYKYIKPISKMF